MKKKLDLACGLVHRPKLLFLDEPSLGLDVQARRTLWDHVLELKQSGTTMILCTNYMEEADKLCDRIAVLDRGKVVVIGTPDELRSGLGGDVITVELADATDQEKTEQLLTEVDFVGDVWHDGDRVHVGVDSNETALPTLLDVLRAGDIQVRGVSYRRPDLEEVFIKHTGHRFADAHGPSGKPPARRGRK